MHRQFHMWQTLSEEATDRATQKLATADGCALAFHSVADGFVRLRPEQFQQLASFVERPARLLERQQPPETVRTMDDVVAALLWCFQTGKALQRMIEDGDLHRRLLEVVGHDESRLGGTSANMAVSLATLGIDPVIVYAYPHSRRVASLFPKMGSLQTYTVEVNPRRILMQELAEQLPANDPPDAPLHWIFEFGPDLKVDIDGHVLRPPRANRFIAGWNPANRQLRLEQAYVDGLLKDAQDVGFFFLSGYHILADEYPDGTTAADVVAPTAEMARRLKQANPRMHRHLELASIGGAAVRQEVLRQVFPHVDSIGLNEVELETFTADSELDLPKIEASEARLTGLYHQLQRLRHQSGARRIHLHDLTNYLVLRRDDGPSPTATRDALLFASAAAAHRARTGTVSPHSAQAGLGEAFSEQGMLSLNHLANALKKQGATPVEPGIWKLGRQWIVAVPHRVVAKPKFTVGLGDLISAAAYVVENLDEQN